MHSLDYLSVKDARKGAPTHFWSKASILLEPWRRAAGQYNHYNVHISKEGVITREITPANLNISQGERFGWFLLGLITAPFTLFLGSLFQMLTLAAEKRILDTFKEPTEEASAEEAELPQEDVIPTIAPADDNANQAAALVLNVADEQYRALRDEISALRQEVSHLTRTINAGQIHLSAPAATQTQDAVEQPRTAPRRQFNPFPGMDRSAVGGLGNAVQELQALHANGDGDHKAVLAALKGSQGGRFNRSTLARFRSAPVLPAFEGQSSSENDTNINEDTGNRGNIPTPPPLPPASKF